LSDRKLKPLPPDPFRHQDSAIARPSGGQGGEHQWVSTALLVAEPWRPRRSRQLVRTGALCRKGSSSICLTRKSMHSYVPMKHGCGRGCRAVAWERRRWRGHRVSRAGSSEPEKCEASLRGGLWVRRRLIYQWIETTKLFRLCGGITYLRALARGASARRSRPSPGALRIATKLTSA